MKKARLHMNWKRLRAVPKKVVAQFALLLALFLLCLVLLARPANYWVDRAQDVQLEIDRVRLIKSFSTKSSRRKLVMEADGQTYYLWYPGNTYSAFSKAVEGRLLTGAETNVSVRIVDNSTLWDILTGRHRIVHLQSETAVFYDMQAERDREAAEDVVLWILILASGLLCAAEAAFIGLAYGVIIVKFALARK